MPETPAALLEITELHAWYGESHVLHGASLTVREGEIVTLLGRNGVGKTTLLRTLMGIVRKRQGRVRVDGSDILDLPPHKVARCGLGYVPEERGIFASLSVHENLLLPPCTGPGGMSLEKIYELFPNLLERTSSQGSKLSGGEQQMLAIARILRTGARLLLLDEPAEGLAPVIVDRIAAVLSLLKASGMTVLLVEQNFRFARHNTDRFYVMEDGRVVDEFAASLLDDRRDDLQRRLGL